MKERIQSFREYIDQQRPFLQTLNRIFRNKVVVDSPQTVVEKDFNNDPAKSEYLASIYYAPGELDEDYLYEPKRSTVLEFAAKFGKDIIHLPAKPKGRLLIGVGLAAMLIAGAKVVYDHQAKNKKPD